MAARNTRPGLVATICWGGLLILTILGVLLNLPPFIVPLVALIVLPILGYWIKVSFLGGRDYYLTAGWAVFFMVCLTTQGIREQIRDEGKQQQEATRFARMMEGAEFAPFLDFLSSRAHREEHDEVKVIGRLRSLLETQNHVHIKISQSGPNWTTWPCERDVVKLCSYVSVRNVLFVISSENVALSGVYVDPLGLSSDRTTGYTGARFFGRIVVKGDNDSVLMERSFDGQSEPPDRVNWPALSPSGSEEPFLRAYSASFLPTFVAVLGEIPGARALIPALRDADDTLCSVIVKEIVARKEAHTVDALIESLREGEPKAGANYGALEALRGLSGRDFGTDVPAWRAWWRERKRSIEY